MAIGKSGQLPSLASLAVAACLPVVCLSACPPAVPAFLPGAAKDISTTWLIAQLKPDSLDSLGRICRSRLATRLRVLLIPDQARTGN